MPARKAPVKQLKGQSLSRRSSPAFASPEREPPFPPVNTAAMANNVQRLGELLDNGGNIESPDNVDRATPLINACRYNKPDAALELIRRGANINATSRDRDTAIGWAAVNGMVEVGRTLIEKGCNMKVEVNGRKTIEEYARDYSDNIPDFHAMIPSAIEARDRRIAAEAAAAARAKDEAYSTGATVLEKPITVTRPISLKR